MAFLSCRRVASLVVQSQGTAKRSLYTVGQEPHFESIDVKCGGSGNTTIHVHNAPKTAPLPLLLYISPTTDSRSLTFPSIPPSFLSKSYTTILIRPLFSPATPFPWPLHVLSYAYSEILKQHVKSGQFNLKPLPPISVYGKGLGGTLATVMALTECRPVNESGSFVDAVMARDSIYDHSPLANEYLIKYAKASLKSPEQETFDMSAYLSPDSDLAYASPPSNDYISGPAASVPADEASSIAASDIRSREGLLKSLPHLFSKPEVAFDPFISPVLFFRGRSHDIPTRWTWNGPHGKRSEMSLLPHERSRSYVKFPPKELRLRIPRARLCVTVEAEVKTAETSKNKRGRKRKEELATVNGNRRDDGAALQALYTEQAELMAAGMRRAIEKGHEDPRLLFDMRHVDASERVQVEHIPQTTASQQERDEMDGMSMNDWLSEFRG